MPIEAHDTELKEFCQEFGTEEILQDETYDYCHFPLETSLDLEDYLSTKDPDRILSQILETGQVSLTYDLLEHINHAELESFSGIIMIYADKNPDGSFSISQDVFNSRSGIADRQSCVVTVEDGNLHIENQ
jgi:hypothetical protein